MRGGSLQTQRGIPNKQRGREGGQAAALPLSSGGCPPHPPRGGGALRRRAPTLCSHALALPCTCLRASARRGAPAAAAGGLQTVSRQCGGVSRSGWRSPQSCEGHICGRGVPTRGIQRGSFGRERNPIPYPATPSPKSAPHPHTPLRRGLLLLQFGAQRHSPCPVEDEDLRTS